MSKKTELATRENLSALIPLFKLGNEASSMFTSGRKLSTHERNKFESQTLLKALAFNKINELFSPIIYAEIGKNLKKFNVPKDEETLAAVNHAALEGLNRGLIKYEIDRVDNTSPTNYLMMWVNSFVTMTLDKIEMPVDMSISHYRKMKKISAVKKKFAEELDRTPTNEELLIYFQSGKADQARKLNGRKTENDLEIKSNRAITLKDIQEQAVFEQQYYSENDLSNIEEYSYSSSIDSSIFELFFTAFNITEEAKAVLSSELELKTINEAQAELLKKISTRKYNTLMTSWKLLITDINGPFFEFINNLHEETKHTSDIITIINAIKKQEDFVKIESTSYLNLFANGEIEKCY